MVSAGDIIRAADSSTDWTAFTPAFTNFTTGNGALGAKYRRVGEFTIELRASFLFGSTSSVGGALGLTLPASLVGEAALLTQVVPTFAWDNSASTGYAGFAKLQGGGGVALDRFYGPNTAAWTTTLPFTWATNDFLALQGYVEVTT